MRVPDLDWPADLFEDASPISESAVASSAGQDIRPVREMPLWSASWRLWMVGAQAPDLSRAVVNG